MKNLIIAVLMGYIVSGMSFWVYDGPSDRWFMAFFLSILVFLVIESFDEMLREIRRKKMQVNRFKKDLEKIKTDLMKPGSDHRSA